MGGAYTDLTVEGRARMPQALPQNRRQVSAVLCSCQHLRITVASLKLMHCVLKQGLPQCPACSCAKYKTYIAIYMLSANTPLFQ